MRALFIIVLIIIGLGFVFWDNIFYSTAEEPATPAEDEPLRVKMIEEENTSIPDPPKESVNYKGSIAQGEWSEALAELEALPDEKVGLNELYAKHLCLLNENRFDEAALIRNAMLAQAPQSPAAVKAVLDEVEKAPVSSLEKRALLSRASGSFSTLNGNDTGRLVAAVQKINAGLPSSIKGLVKMEKYKVVPNDCLWDICKKYRQENGHSIESGLIHRLNGMKSDVIYPGQALTIPKEKLQLRIYRNNWLLAVFLGDTLLDAYRVGLGKEGSTPEGKFVIKSKLENPDWYSDSHRKIIPHGDPENILGTRWLGFENREDARGFGIHGTTEPESIGKNMSSGCIRMINNDVENLFKIIARGTPVEVL